MAHEREQEASRRDPAAAVANPGTVRPPWVYLASREERYLEARFPAEYPAYKRAVRRWL